MADKTLKLGSIYTELGDDKKTYVKLGSVLFDAGDGKGDVTVLKKGAKVEKGSSASFNMGTVGVLKIDAEGKLTLQAGSDVTGVVTISDETAGDHAALEKLEKITFSKPVEFDVANTTLKSVTGSSYADKFTVTSAATDFVLNAGSGDDEITISGSSDLTVGTIDANSGNDKITLNITGAKLKGDLKLGSGKDTLVAGAGEATIADYNFKEDVIQMTGTVTLDKKGVLSNGSASITGAMTDNDVYYIKNASATADTPVTVYATVAEKATEAVVNASSLTGTDVAIIDASEATSSSKITTGKNDITNITLAASKSEDTLVIGDTTTKKTITVTNFASDDVLSMSGLTLDKTEVSLENDEGAKIVNGKNTVILGSVVTDKKVAKFGLNDKTVYAAVGASATINVTAEDDLSKLYIKGYNTGKDTTLVAGGSVDLTSANIYDIYNVSLTKDAANATLKGFKTDADHGLNLNASAVTDGAVIWANNSSKAIDTITLNTTQNGADTVVVASTDGSDIVNGFQLENDVLYVTDSTAMTFDAGKATIGKAEITFAGTVIKDSEEIMQVQAQKTGKLYHVAGDLDASSPEVTLGENANKVDYYAVKKDTTVSLTSAFSDTYSFFKNTVAGYGEAANVVKGGSVTSIDATNATSDSTLMIEGVANVSVGAGTNQVWVHGAAKDGNVQLNSGADTVWFGAEDKNVTVAAYNSESDVINLMGTIGSFTAKADGGKTVITSTAGKGKLSVDTDTIVLVETATNDKYTMKTGTGVGSYDTNTDTKSIYQGYETLYASNVTDDTTIILGYGSNALAAQNNLKSAAIIEKTVKTFDANGATGNFKIVGDASVNNTISGGDGTNYLNGGGASKDTLRGVSSATDNFYWGTTDGNDTLENVGAEDIVQLYDIKLADIDVATTVKNLKSDKAVIVLNSQQKLTINSTIEDGTTFALADATYVIEDGKFVAKQ